MKPALFLMMILGTTGYLTAQEAPATKTAPPPGPLIQKRAPDFAEWSTTLKFSDDDASQEGEPNPPSSPDPKNIASKATVTKTGNITRVVYTDFRQEIWTTWILGETEVAEWPDKKSIAFAAQPQNSTEASSLYWNFSSSDFPGFEWISADTFVGIKQVHGSACLTFKTVQVTNGVNQSLFAATDLQTRLPVQLENSSGVTSYEFNSSPPTMLSLPENVAKLILYKQNKEKSLARAPLPAF